MSLSSPTSPRAPVSRSTTVSPKLTITPLVHRGASYEQPKQAAAILSKLSSLPSPHPRQGDYPQSAGLENTKTDYFSDWKGTPKDTSESCSVSSMKNKPGTNVKCRRSPTLNYGSAANILLASSYFSFPDFEHHYQGPSQSDDKRVSESCRAR